MRHVSKVKTCVIDRLLDFSVCIMHFIHILLKNEFEQGRYCSFENTKNRKSYGIPKTSGILIKTKQIVLEAK